MSGHRFFDPYAPFTIRLASILIIPAAAWEFVARIHQYVAHADPDMGLWKGIARPTISLALAVLWARGLAKMQGIYYWLLVIPLYFLLLMGVTVLLVSGPSVLLDLVLEAEVVEIAHGALWIVCAVLLMSKQSVVAFRHHGRIEKRQK